MKIKIFIDDTISEFSRETLTDWHYDSRALFCPICYRVWARIEVDGNPVLHARTVPCDRCPWHTLLKHGISGSLLEQGIHAHVDLCFLDALPEELLRREFRIHLRAYGIILYDTYDPDVAFRDLIYLRRGEYDKLSERGQRLAADVLNRAKPPLRG